MTKNQNNEPEEQESAEEQFDPQALSYIEEKGIKITDLPADVQAKVKQLQDFAAASEPDMTAWESLDEATWNDVNDFLEAQDEGSDDATEETEETEEAATEETEESTESTEATANTEKKKPASAAFPTAVKPEAEKPKEKRFMDKFLGRK